PSAPKPGLPKGWRYTQFLYTLRITVRSFVVDHVPEPTRLLYAQLLSQCLHGAAPSGRGLSFVAKRIKGGKHWYLQLSIGSRKTQHYLGPDTDAVRALIEKEKSLWATAAPDLRARENLVSML